MTIVGACSTQLGADVPVRTLYARHSCLACAAKVYKELFKSGASAVLVDAAGTEWECLVHSEARNDLRPQYTLRVRSG